MGWDHGLKMNGSRNSLFNSDGVSRDRTAPDSENRQVIDSANILQCPERLKRLQCRFIVRLLYGEFVQNQLYS
jgi:hypothetical protein